MVTLDTFNIISGIVGIISFLFSIYLYLHEKALKENIESGLLGLIGNLDDLAYSSGERGVTKKVLEAKSMMIRNQAIAILKSFSDTEKRFHTFDFGFTDDDIEQRIKKRKEALGIDRKGCIVEGQHIRTVGGVKPVNSISIGEKLVSFLPSSPRKADSSVISFEKHHVNNYLLINNVLAVTANHLILTRSRDWVEAIDLTIGDEIFSFDNEWVMIKSICFIEQEVDSFSLKLSEIPVYFVEGFLVHNSPKH
jgi:hypothetical protein